MSLHAASHAPCCQLQREARALCWWTGRACFRLSSSGSCQHLKSLAVFCSFLPRFLTRLLFELPKPESADGFRLAVILTGADTNAAWFSHLREVCTQKCVFKKLFSYETAQIISYVQTWRYRISFFFFFFTTAVSESGSVSVFLSFFFFFLSWWVYVLVAQWCRKLLH